MDKEMLGLHLIGAGFLSLLISWMVMMTSDYFIQYLIPLHLIPIGFYLVIHYNRNNNPKNSEVLI